MMRDLPNLVSRMSEAPRPSSYHFCEPNRFAAAHAGCREQANQMVNTRRTTNAICRRGLAGGLVAPKRHVELVYCSWKPSRARQSGTIHSLDPRQIARHAVCVESTIRPAFQRYRDFLASTLFGAAREPIGCGLFRSVLAAIRDYSCGDYASAPSEQHT